jgi:hypothetical protein
MKTIINRLMTTTRIILILPVVSCQHFEQIKKEITPPELRDSIIQWEKIMNCEPELIYCLTYKNNEKQRKYAKP